MKFGFLAILSGVFFVVGATTQPSSEDLLEGVQVEDQAASLTYGQREAIESNFRDLQETTGEVEAYGAGGGFGGYRKPCSIPCMFKIMKARKCQLKYRCCGNQFRHPFTAGEDEDLQLSSGDSMMESKMDLDMIGDMGMGDGDMEGEDGDTTIEGVGWNKRYCPYKCMYFVYEAWKCQTYNKCCRTRPYRSGSGSSTRPESGDEYGSSGTD